MKRYEHRWYCKENDWRGTRLADGRDVLLDLGPDGDLLAAEKKNGTHVAFKRFFIAHIFIRMF